MIAWIVLVITGLILGGGFLALATMVVISAIDGDEESRILVGLIAVIGVLVSFGWALSQVLS